MQGEDMLQWVCGAEPNLMEGSQDTQVQERGGWSVPLVAWTDREGAQGSCHLPSSPIGRCQHWSLTPVYG